tara:strand:- start:593 stop:757 length:165 start_codon:yes stop_codon:yes gene_type:complete
MKKITEFFANSWMLFIFSIKTFWIIFTDDMKKESQEQIEEREYQQLIKKRRNRK